MGKLTMLKAQAYLEAGETEKSAMIRPLLQDRICRLGNPRICKSDSQVHYFALLTTNPLTRRELSPTTDFEVR
jgi:hypothetical protein